MENDHPKNLLSINGQLSARFVDKICERLIGNRDQGPLHVLLCSDGGESGAGVRLYEFFSHFSGDLTVYASVAQSAAAIAFLGAPKKKVLPYGTVMFHAVMTQMGGLANIENLRAAIEVASGQDRTLRAIVGKHLPNITKAEWKSYDDGHFYVSFDRLVALGLLGASDQCDFPAGRAAHIVPGL